jgi:hypothetical protein
VRRRDRSASARRADCGDTEVDRRNIGDDGERVDRYQEEHGDRTKEMLSSSDVGIVLLRRMHKEQLERLAAELDPIGTVRDPAKNRCIELPIEHNKLGETAMFHIVRFKHQAICHSPIVTEINAMFDEAERGNLVTAK